MAYVKEIPTRVLMLRVQTNTTAQLQQSLSIGRLSIFGKERASYVRPGVAQSESNLNDKIVTLPVDFQLDNLADISYTILASTDVTLTFFCGASANVAAYLRRRASKGKTTTSLVGAAPIMRNSIQQKVTPVISLD